MKNKTKIPHIRNSS